MTDLMTDLTPASSPSSSFYPSPEEALAQATASAAACWKYAAAGDAPRCDRELAAIRQLLWWMSGRWGMEAPAVRAVRRVHSAACVAAEALRGEGLLAASEDSRPSPQP